jgi:hypothetical protein
VDKTDPIVLRCAQDHPLVTWTAKRSDPTSRACPVCGTTYLPLPVKDGNDR